MINRFVTKFGKATTHSLYTLLLGIGLFSVSLGTSQDSLAAQQIEKDSDKPDPTSSSSVTGSADTKSDNKNDSVSKGASDPVVGSTYSDPVAVKWKVGVKISAGATDARNIYIAIPVPNEWPEQTVVVDSEEMPPSVGDVTYNNLVNGIRRQLIKIPLVRAGEQIELTTIFKVSTSQVNGPPNTAVFLKPDSKLTAGKEYLEKTRYIMFHNARIREQIATLVEGKEEAWKQVEAIYDWVRDNIDQKEMPNTDTLKTFRTKVGSEEDKVALFIAMCRSHKIPARTVWVDGGCYAEFLLVDSQGVVHWFPCNVTGVREFGSISEPRIVLQKGENIKIPEKKERQKYVAEHMSCQGTSRPAVAFVRELLPNDE